MAHRPLPNIVTWSDGSGTHSNTAMGMWGMNAPNGSPSHPCHELIEADNDNNPSSYRAGMYFPGTRQVTKLSSQTHAEFKTWAGLPVGIEIDDIRQQADGNITFTVKKSDAASLSVTVKTAQGNCKPTPTSASRPSTRSSVNRSWSPGAW